MLPIGWTQLEPKRQGSSANAVQRSASQGIEYGEERSGEANREDPAHYAMQFRFDPTGMLGK